jgi:hypothetical protein
MNQEDDETVKNVSVIVTDYYFVILSIHINCFHSCIVFAVTSFWCSVENCIVIHFILLCKDIVVLTVILSS